MEAMQYLLNIASWCGWPLTRRDDTVSDIELGNQPPERSEITKSVSALTHSQFGRGRLLKEPS
jgi:hypothetical protein